MFKNTVHRTFKRPTMISLDFHMQDRSIGRACVYLLHDTLHTTSFCHADFQSIWGTRVPVDVNSVAACDYRVSQINACAFCLDMHSKDLRARGETEQRIYMVNAWRDAPNLYSSRERAALAWAESVTKLVDQKVPDEVYEQARAEFSETELVQLTLAVISINGWNRLNIAFHTPAGSYVSNVARSVA